MVGHRELGSGLTYGSCARRSVSLMMRFGRAAISQDVCEVRKLSDLPQKTGYDCLRKIMAMTSGRGAKASCSRAIPMARPCRQQWNSLGSERKKQKSSRCQRKGEADVVGAEGSSFDCKS